MQGKVAGRGLIQLALCSLQLPGRGYKEGRRLFLEVHNDRTKQSSVHTSKKMFTRRVVKLCLPIEELGSPFMGVIKT